MIEPKGDREFFLLKDTLFNIETHVLVLDDLIGTLRWILFIEGVREEKKFRQKFPDAKCQPRAKMDMRYEVPSFVWEIQKAEKSSSNELEIMKNTSRVSAFPHTNYPDLKRRRDELEDLFVSLRRANKSFSEAKRHLSRLKKSLEL